ncbi:MAG: ribosome maturation factor RimP [Proteobacteria bacterium]|nr:ribosome maturation factor RimP [Pseudomonadota bacterium]MCL2306848.1 ribosome maturation factor RimP [Pseudomonadota bacterium]
MNIGDLLETTLPGLGFELADWEMSPRGRTIRVFIDTPEGAAAGVTVEDCAAVSHHLTRLFAVENIDYDRLEVSSPGLDRPLRKLTDFARFIGSEAQLVLREPMEGSRKMKVLLCGVEDDRVLVEHAGAALAIEHHQIERARLVPKLEWRKAK